MGRGQGRVFQRGGILWIAYSLNGKEYRESAQTADLKEAERFLRGKIKEVGADQIGARKMVTPQSRKLTICDLCDALRTKYELLKKASPQNLSHLKRVEADFGHYRALSLSSGKIKEYIKARQDAGHADAAINRTTGMLLQCYRNAVEQKLFSDFDVPSIIHLDETGNARQGFLEPTQFKKLLAEIPVDLKDFVEWSYKTGQRKGEASSMTWDMLSKEGDVLRLPGNIAKNRKARNLPISSDLAKILARRQAVRTVNVNGAAEMCKFIFHRKGEPVGDFKKSWRTACKAAGVGNTLFHDLRRSFVKNLTDAGVRASLAMKVGGWSTESMLKRYRIETDKEVLAAMEQTDKHVAAEMAKAQA
jgi:integrase